MKSVSFAVLSWYGFALILYLLKFGDGFDYMARLYLRLACDVGLPRGELANSNAEEIEKLQNVFDVEHGTLDVIFPSIPGLVVRNQALTYGDSK